MRFFENLFKRVKNAEEIADDLANVVAKDALIHLRNREFCRYISLQGLSNDEKISIQLELELSGITFVYLLLESLEAYYENQTTKEAFRSIRNSVTAAFVRYVKHGVHDSKMHEMATQLVARRCEECRAGLRQHLNEFKPGDLKRNYWSGICAENLLNHLVDYGSSADKEIFEHLAIWNVRLGNEIQKAILKRAKINVERGWKLF